MNVSAVTLGRLTTISCFAAFTLVGCASLSESECRSGDWQTVGYRDGQNGRPLSRLDEHHKACAQFGVGINDELYREGRERGLLFYCTPTNGLAVGRRGEFYAGVCPTRLEGNFLSYYSVGRDIYDARQRVEHLEDEQRQLIARRNKVGDKEDARHLDERIYHLRMEREIAWEELQRREAWASSIRY
jgi:hypothetical protein